MIQEIITAHISLCYELGDVFLFLTVLIFISGFLISRFDSVPLEHATYFTFITAFTVGFGDMVPKSRGARIMTIILAFFGLMLIGIAVVIAAQAIDIDLKTSVL